MSTREHADRIEHVLRRPGSSLLPIPDLAEQTGLSPDEVRAAIQDHYTEFRISPKPVGDHHLVGLREHETTVQRLARLLDERSGRTAEVLLR